MVITMPNMSAHMAIAKRVSDALNINSDDFIKFLDEVSNKILGEVKKIM